MSSPVKHGGITLAEHAVFHQGHRLGDLCIGRHSVTQGTPACCPDLSPGALSVKFIRVLPASALGHYQRRPTPASWALNLAVMHGGLPKSCGYPTSTEGHHPDHVVI